MSSPVPTAEPRRSRLIADNGSILLCTVRGCRQPLLREGLDKARRVVCSRGHSFDLARSGYINLLQPQDRRSKQPGDSSDAVAARRRLHDLGVTQSLLDAITAILQSGFPATQFRMAGCGEGFTWQTWPEPPLLEGV